MRGIRKIYYYIIILQWVLGQCFTAACAYVVITIISTVIDVVVITNFHGESDALVIIICKQGAVRRTDTHLALRTLVVTRQTTRVRK